MDLKVEAGTLLASAPHMRDANFMHTVVFICEHTEQGAYGMVVNLQSELSTDLILPDHEVLKEQVYPVHSGGPVALDTLQILHRLPELIPGGIEISRGVFLGGELDCAAEVVSQRGLAALNSLRFILGYSGWGEGQLEGELVAGGWLPAALDVDSLFGTDQQGVWRKVVRSVGHGTEGMEELPPDVSWN